MRASTSSLFLLGLLCSSPGFAADAPQRKEGLWEMKMSNETQGSGMGPMKQCIDAKTDAAMQKQAMQGGGQSTCSKQSFKKTATGWTSDAVCKHGDTTSTSHSVISGDLNSAYTIDTQVRFDPPMDGKSEMRSKIAVRWIGACPAGWKPGDIEMGGRRFNSLEMQKTQAGAQPGGKMSPEQMKQMIEAMKKQQGAN